MGGGVCRVAIWSQGRAPKKHAYGKWREETGLKDRVRRLIGIYASPHVITEYADGSRIQEVNHYFEAEQVGGELRLSDETTEIGYFSLDEMKSLDLSETHYQRIVDAFSDSQAAFVR